MGRLQGHFLGGFRLTAGTVTVDGLTTRKSRALVAYLMLNPTRPFGRHALAETIWGDTRTGDVMKALRQELWLIRRAFRDAGLDPETHFSLTGEELSVRDMPSVDAVAFEATADSYIKSDNRAINETNAGELEQAIELYRGDLLPGLYDDWCLFPREILRDKYIIVVERLMGWHAKRQNWGAALIQGKRLLDVDPLLEHVHRDMMRFHYARGDRPAALRQYAQCKQQMRHDLTIEPMAETTALYEAIRKENDVDIMRHAATNRAPDDRQNSGRARPPPPPYRRSTPSAKTSTTPAAASRP